MYGLWLFAAFLLRTSEPQHVYLSAHIRDLTKYAFRYTVCTRTTRGCLRLFRAQTAETTLVDMTLGCARMWIAHAEFHTCCYATGQMLRSVGQCPMSGRYFAHCNYCSRYVAFSMLSMLAVDVDECRIQREETVELALKLVSRNN